MLSAIRAAPLRFSSRRIMRQMVCLPGDIVTPNIGAGDIVPRQGHSLLAETRPVGYHTKMHRHSPATCKQIATTLATAMPPRDLSGPRR